MRLLILSILISFLGCGKHKSIEPIQWIYFNIESTCDTVDIKLFNPITGYLPVPYSNKKRTNYDTIILNCTKGKIKIISNGVIKLDSTINESKTFKVYLK